MRFVVRKARAGLPRQLAPQPKTTILKQRKPRTPLFRGTAATATWHTARRAVRIVSSSNHSQLSRFESRQKSYRVVALDGSQVVFAEHSQFAQRASYSLAVSAGRKIGSEHDLVRVHELLQ